MVLRVEVEESFGYKKISCPGYSTIPLLLDNGLLILRVILKCYTSDHTCPPISHVHFIHSVYKNGIKTFNPKTHEEMSSRVPNKIIGNRSILDIMNVVVRKREMCPIVKVSTDED